MFGIVVKFPWRKSGSILPYFRGGNLAALRLGCIIAHKTLFSLSFCCKNMTTKVSYFHDENSVEFRVWCTMAHQQDFMPMYTHVPTCLCWNETKPLKASNLLMRVAYMGKPISFRWQRLRQSHHDDHAHNIAWICTYNNCLECIPTLQGQEHLWLQWVAFLATRVHHTKCTITHIQAYIDIHISRIMLSHRAGK